MAMHQDEILEPIECANCGATEKLLKCSRCHVAWFCGVKCQKAYWPFHKSVCKRNEFADIIEESEPKFARWMRNHGKLAVLKDDEVDRLERASKSVSGVTREDVMESMYGRLDPKPQAPHYSAEERLAMQRQEEAQAAQAHKAALCGASYLAIDLPQDLGLDCQFYKWRQNQSIIEVFVPLPEGTTSHQVQVALAPSSIRITVQERPILHGALYKEIKAEESTWYIQDSVLEITLLKRNRRGHYEKGTTNADTYWRSVVKSAPPTETLALQHPPTAYYWSYCEDEQPKAAPRLTTAQKKAIQEQRLGAAASQGPATPLIEAA